MSVGSARLSLVQQRALSGPRKSSIISTDQLGLKMRSVGACAVVLDTVPSQLDGATPSLPLADAVLMQAFGWESCRQGHWWDMVASKASEMADAGITHVWLPPPSQSVSQEGYLPSQLYNFNSAYGSEAELRECIQTLKAAGLKAVVDAVFNHRCADTQNKEGQWVLYSDAHEPEGVATCAWNERAITSDDPEFGGQGSTDTGDDFHAAPDLDHTSDDVQAGLTDFTKYLVENLGFEGIRFDFSRGYGGQYAARYAQAALKADQLAVGEYWVPLDYDSEGKMLRNQEKHRERVHKWLDEAQGRCLAFDFGTKGILQDAIRFEKYHWLVDSKKRPHGLIGTRPEAAVTFIDNHDTGSTQRHWPFPRMKKLEGYAYLMTHPGLPTVFWEHFEESDKMRNEIAAMIRLRKAVGVHSTSPVSVLATAADQYVADIRGSRGTFRLRIGPKEDMGKHEPSPEDGWGEACKGGTYCIWVKYA